MAKKKRALRPGKTQVNKSALVREAMERGHTAPLKIAEYIKTVHRETVTPAYVSSLKNKFSKRTATANVRPTKIGAHTRKQEAGDVEVEYSMQREPAAKTQVAESPLSAGIRFIRAVGSLQNAHKALDLIEEIKRL